MKWSRILSWFMRFQQTGAGGFGPDPDQRKQGRTMIRLTWALIVIGVLGIIVTVLLIWLKR